MSVLPSATSWSGAVIRCKMVLVIGIVTGLDETLCGQGVVIASIQKIIKAAAKLLVLKEVFERHRHGGVMEIDLRGHFEFSQEFIDGFRLIEPGVHIHPPHRRCSMSIRAIG